MEVQENGLPWEDTGHGRDRADDNGGHENGGHEDGVDGRTSRGRIAEVLSAMEAMLSCVDHSGDDRLEAEDLVDVMVRVRRLAGRVQALAWTYTDLAARMRATEAAASTPITDFLMLTEGRTAKDASRHVHEAQRVNGQEALREAALTGRATADQAAAAGRVMTELPLERLDREQTRRAAEKLLERAATTGSARMLARCVDEVLSEVAPELVPDPEDAAARAERQRLRAHRRRELRWGNDGQGSVWFSGQLPEGQAEGLFAQIDARVESRRHTMRRSREDLRDSHDRGAIEESTYRALLRQLEEDDAVSPAQRRLDALVDLIGDVRNPPTVAGDRPVVVVTIQERDLRQRALDAGLLASGTPIGAGELRRLCCDADLVPRVLGTDSQVLDVGTEHRLVTARQRAELTRRDGGCVFPGCGAVSARCEAHHIVPWWAGGRTDLDNLALLCPHHHKIVEPARAGPIRAGASRDRWTVRMNPRTRRPEVIPPTCGEKWLGDIGPGQECA